MNPYGTLRIITKELCVLNGLYYLVKSVLEQNDTLPHQLHDIRRTFKQIGVVVSCEAICKNNNGWKYFKNNETSVYDEFENYVDEQTVKIFDLFFSGQYEDELKNYRINVNDIVSWNFDTIIDLGANKVKSIFMMTMMTIGMD